MRSKLTPLEIQMSDVRLDQFVVDSVLKQFDFALAEKLVAIYAEQRALSESRPLPKVWKPSANELRAAAAKMVLDVLKLGREDAGDCSVHGSFMVARYKLGGEAASTMEIVELDLSTVHSFGLRPRASYIADIRAYLDAMGGGWLDEDGRWKPGEPPTFTRGERS